MAEVADSGDQIMAFKELLVFVLAVVFRPLLWVMSSFFLPRPLV